MNDTNCCCQCTTRFLHLIDVTLVCEDANSKLVGVVTFADVCDVNHVGNSLLQIWKLRFGHKALLLLRLSAQGLVKILDLKVQARFWSEVCSDFQHKFWLRLLKLKFRRDFETEVWSVFCAEAWLRL